MKSLKYRIIKQVIASVMIVSFSVLSTTVVSMADEAPVRIVPVLLKDLEKKKVINSQTDSNSKIASEDPPFTASNPSITTTSGHDIDGMTMLYIGGAIGAIALGAIALGGGSGSSSGSGPIIPVPEPEPIVGPDLNGANWVGYLDLVNERATGYQNISARVTQVGSSVEITTTSTLAYGQHFSGTIKSNGYMTMYDSVTGEDWTTLKGNARVDSIDLYDYVNDFRDLDRMLLTR